MNTGFHVWRETTPRIQGLESLRISWISIWAVVLDTFHPCSTPPSALNTIQDSIRSVYVSLGGFACGWFDILRIMHWNPVWKGKTVLPKTVVTKPSVKLESIEARKICFPAIKRPRIRWCIDFHAMYHGTTSLGFSRGNPGTLATLPWGFFGSVPFAEQLWYRQSETLFGAFYLRRQ